MKQALSMTKMNAGKAIVSISNLYIIGQISYLPIIEIVPITVLICTIFMTMAHSHPIEIQ